jgi:hypothetical protein
MLDNSLVHHYPSSRRKRASYTTGHDMSFVATVTKGGFHLRQMPTSIGTLSPKSSFVVSMNKRPLARDVTRSLVIGEKGIAQM